MKKLLVLTDFSANAFHAEAIALHLSARLDTGMLLYHTLPFIPLIANDLEPYVTEAPTLLFEDSKEHLTQEAEKLKMLAAAAGGLQAQIEYKTGEGTLADVISELSADADIELVVMGGRSGGAMEHFLTGSETSAVIQKARKPVLIIPTTAEWDIPKKIVFATDFKQEDKPAISFLVKLSERLGFKLDVVHVLRNGGIDSDIGREIAFRDYLVREQLTCNQVFGENVIQELKQYCREQNADVLAMYHGRHPFISKLFRHSESHAAISDQQLALLIFPPDYQQHTIRS